MDSMVTAQDKNQKANPERKDVHLMFDRISGRYDLLNRLLSMRRDVVWRKKVAQLLPERENLSVLDLATGTGDLVLSLFENCPRVTYGVGLDMAGKMLEIAQDKVVRKNMSPKIELIRSDATELPVGDNRFSAVTIAFGIRNVTDVNRSLCEMHRILEPNGKALILEFSLPENKLIRSGYLFYFRRILPAIGSIVSGDGYAYRYLNQTVETFPYGQQFCALMENAGFENVKEHCLTLGIATIYEGTKR